MAFARTTILRILGTTTLLAVGRALVLPVVFVHRAGCCERRVLRRAADADGERREVYILDEQQTCELNDLGELVNCRPDADDDSESSLLGSSGCLKIVRRRKWPRFRDLLDEFGEVNPYKVLGVNSWASQEEIRSAYMKVCKTEHPDLNKGVESMEWLVVSKAYQTLSQRRLTYTVKSTARSVGAVAGGFMEVMFAAVAAGAKAVNAAKSRKNEKP